MLFTIYINKYVALLNQNQFFLVIFYNCFMFFQFFIFFLYFLYFQFCFQFCFLFFLILINFMKFLFINLFS